MYRQLLKTIFLSSLLFFSCKKETDDPQPTKGSIEGFVKTFKDSIPTISVKNTQVLLNGKSVTTTDTDGRFYFKNIEQGTQHLTFSHDWYKTQNISVNVNPGNKPTGWWLWRCRPNRQHRALLCVHRHTP